LKVGLFKKKEYGRPPRENSRDFDVNQPPELINKIRRMNFFPIRERILISADTEFATLLALRESTKPSFILFRREDHRPDHQVSLLLANLPDIALDLKKGAVIVFEEARIRIRTLPILRRDNE